MTARSFEKLRYAVASGGVATITLADPSTRNALSHDMLGELGVALSDARDDEAVRCIVLTSGDEKVFSSGGNLSGFADEEPLIAKHFASERFPRVLTLLMELGKPSICAANGHVLAGALGLALACDLIVAKRGVSFGTPEINVGLFPFMVMALLFRNVPRKKCVEMLMLGERVDADEAERLGFVNRVLPADEFDTTVSEWAGRLASKSPVLMRLGKDAMARHQDMSLADALEFLRQNFTLALSTEDSREGVIAFLEKREPIWRGR